MSTQIRYFAGAESDSPKIRLSPISGELISFAEVGQRALMNLGCLSVFVRYAGESRVQAKISDKTLRGYGFENDESLLYRRMFVMNGSELFPIELPYGVSFSILGHTKSSIMESSACLSQEWIDFVGTGGGASIPSMLVELISRGEIGVIAPRNLFALDGFDLMLFRPKSWPGS